MQEGYFGCRVCDSLESRSAESKRLQPNDKQHHIGRTLDTFPFASGDRKSKKCNRTPPCLSGTFNKHCGRRSLFKLKPGLHYGAGMLAPGAMLRCSEV